MALKTILVHLADDPDHVARLATAMRLAKRHGAHLVALYVTQPYGLPHEVAGRGASLTYLRDSKTRTEEMARKVKAEFVAACDREGLTYDWLVEDSEHLDSLARHAQAADLVVVSRDADKHFEDRFRLLLPEELVMVTGLPILVLPPDFPSADPGRRILVCWKPTREAVRAIRDALPLLVAAEAVFIATVRPTTEDAVATLAVQQYLARHGVTVETLDVQEGSGGVGATLLHVAEAHGCDLVVSGAYGHARLREVLVGGVTRALFRHAKVPLLLSH